MKRRTVIPSAIALALIVAFGVFVGPRFVDAQGVDGDAANAAAIEALATAVAANDDAVKSFATAISAHDVAVQAFATAVSANAESPAPQPTVEPTVEPTSTPVLPGPEPTPTVEPEPTPVAVNSCALPIQNDADGRFTLPVTLNGEWVGGCVYPFDLKDTIGGSAASGDRYYRTTSFKIVASPGSWVATLESDIDTFMLLWEYDRDENGLIVEGSFNLVDTNDDLASGNSNSRIEWTPNLSKSYALDFTTYAPETLGEFTVTIEAGSANTQNSSAIQDLMPADVSGDMRFEQRQE